MIARDTDNLFSTITINKGSRGGVQKGMTVVAYQQDMEGLVGKVVAVGPGSSEILPLYDPQCMVSARLDRTRDEGLVNGEGKDSGTILMRYVKSIAKDTIEYGDLVVTSGLGGFTPKGSTSDASAISGRRRMRRPWRSRWSRWSTSIGWNTCSSLPEPRRPTRRRRQRERRCHEP